MLVLANLLFIAIGLAGFYRAARRTSVELRLVAIALTLLSWPILRISIMAHPDALGFALTMWTLAILTSITGERSSRNLALVAACFTLILMTATIRVAGVLLLVPFLWIVLGIIVPAGTPTRTKLLIVAAAVLGVAAVLLISEAGTFTRYRYEVAQVLDRGPIAHALYRLETLLKALGELWVNLALHRFVTARQWLSVIGLIPAALFLFTMRRTEWPRPVTIYFVVHILTMVIWPFYTTRLWVAVIPFMLLHVVTTFRDSTPLVRKIGVASAIWFVATGTVALGYVSWVSLSGADFRFRWGTNGGFAAEGEEQNNHNRNAGALVRRLDAGNRAWTWLDSVPDARLAPGQRLDVRAPLDPVDPGDVRLTSQPR